MANIHFNNDQSIDDEQPPILTNSRLNSRALTFEEQQKIDEASLAALEANLRILKYDLGDYSTLRYRNPRLTSTNAYNTEDIRTRELNRVTKTKMSPWKKLKNFFKTKKAKPVAVDSVIDLMRKKKHRRMNEGSEANDEPGYTEQVRQFLKYNEFKPKRLHSVPEQTGAILAFSHEKNDGSVYKGNRITFQSAMVENQQPNTLAETPSSDDEQPSTSKYNTKRL